MRLPILIGKFLAWTKTNRDIKTHEFYSRYLSSLTLDMEAADLRSHHLQDWLDQTHAPHAIRVITRLYNWAVNQDLLERSPLKKFDRPVYEARQTNLTKFQWNRFESRLEGRFKDIAMFLRWTGCRPQEARAIEARHLKGNQIEFPVKESKGKRYSRVIPLPACALEMLQDLARRRPKGKLFLNQRGRPWTASALNLAFDRASEGLGFTIFPYLIRSFYITMALEQNMAPAKLAAIVGHRSLTMIMQVYSKLHCNIEARVADMEALLAT